MQFRNSVENSVELNIEYVYILWHSITVGSTVKLRLHTSRMTFRITIPSMWSEVLIIYNMKSFIIVWNCLYRPISIFPVHLFVLFVRHTFFSFFHRLTVNDLRRKPTYRKIDKRFLLKIQFCLEMFAFDLIKTPIQDWTEHRDKETHHRLNNRHKKWIYGVCIIHKTVFVVK